MLAVVCGIIRYDVLLAFRRRVDVLTTLSFFAIASTLFPLAVGADPVLLRAMAPGIVWVAALLASMLSLGRLFATDFDDGTLEQMLVSVELPSLVVTGKIIAHWLVSGLPLVLFAPVVALQYDMPPAASVALLQSLLIGTPLLSLIGAIGAALTLGVRGGGVLMALIVFPLYVPVLVFGAGAVAGAGSGSGGGAELLLLAGALLATAVIAAPATTAALRIAIE
jgi:heme exporter protein B